MERKADSSRTSLHVYYVCCSNVGNHQFIICSTQFGLDSKF
jgi:hypothetical protein